MAPAMAKEFFDAHFHPGNYPVSKRFTNGLNYLLTCLMFNAFPLPQRESGAREAPLERVASRKRDHAPDQHTSVLHTHPPGQAPASRCPNPEVMARPARRG